MRVEETASSADFRLAARRAIARAKQRPRFIVQRVLRTQEAGLASDKDEEPCNAVDRLALIHLRRISFELQDEIRDFVEKNLVCDSGLLSFLLPENSSDSRRDAIATILQQTEKDAIRLVHDSNRSIREKKNGEKENIHPQIGALPSFGSKQNGDEVPATPPSSRPPFTIPRISQMGDIRDFSDMQSGRGIQYDENEFDMEESTSCESSETGQLAQKVANELGEDKEFMRLFRERDEVAVLDEMERRIQAEMDRREWSRISCDRRSLVKEVRDAIASDRNASSPSPSSSQAPKVVEKQTETEGPPEIQTVDIGINVRPVEWNHPSHADFSRNAVTQATELVKSREASRGEDSSLSSSGAAVNSTSDSSSLSAGQLPSSLLRRLTEQGSSRIFRICPLDGRVVEEEAEDEVVDAAEIEDSVRVHESSQLLPSKARIQPGQKVPTPAPRSTPPSRKELTQQRWWTSPRQTTEAGDQSGPRLREVDDYATSNSILAPSGHVPRLCAKVGHSSPVMLKEEEEREGESVATIREVKEEKTTPCRPRGIRLSEAFFKEDESQEGISFDEDGRNIENLAVPRREDDGNSQMEEEEGEEEYEEEPNTLDALSPLPSSD